eukprot:9808937-Heterocapsa_arctica.AAC.1
MHPAPFSGHATEGSANGDEPPGHTEVQRFDWRGFLIRHHVPGLPPTASVRNAGDVDAAGSHRAPNGGAL